MTELRANDHNTWLDTIWDALHGFREDCIPEGEPRYDDQWSEITTAMAWITETLTGEDTNFTVAVALSAVRGKMLTTPLTGEEALKMLTERLRDDGVNVDVKP